MDQVHLLLLSDNDAKKIAAIIANVPDVSSPQEAVSWALSNVNIPSGAKPFIIKWITVEPGSLSPGTTTPIREPEDHIPLPTQPHKTEVFKIDMGKLPGFKGSAIVEVGALRQITSSPADCAAVLQGAKLGILE
jgi:hypothetical protein